MLSNYGGHFLINQPFRTKPSPQKVVAFFVPKIDMPTVANDGVELPQRASDS
jgi:hypothetical protein